MIETALQILLILAYLAIGLIAVTFPVYAICVVYLKVEKSETEKERKKRLKIVQSGIADLSADALKMGKDSESLRKINVEIKKYQTEKDQLESGLESLTAKGAVRDPLIFLGMALFASVAGIISANMETSMDTMIVTIVLGLCSFGSCVLALSLLYATIKRIEHAALRKERTVDFEICYKSKATVHEIKSGKEEEIAIGVRPEEDVENFEARVLFPPQIEVTQAPPPAYVTIQSEEYDSPGYSLVLIEKPFLSNANYWGILFLVRAEQAGEYMIRIHVRGKGIAEYSSELTLRVKE